MYTVSSLSWRTGCINLRRSLYTTSALTLHRYGAMAATHRTPRAPQAQCTQKSHRNPHSAFSPAPVPKQARALACHVQELGPEKFWVSEAIFGTLFVSFIIWTFTPFVLQRKRFYTVVMWSRLLMVLVGALLIPTGPGFALLESARQQDLNQYA